MAHEKKPQMIYKVARNIMPETSGHVHIYVEGTHPYTSEMLAERNGLTFNDYGKANVVASELNMDNFRKVQVPLSKMELEVIIDALDQWVGKMGDGYRIFERLRDIYHTEFGQPATGEKAQQIIAAYLGE
jgi:hypothetical protein